MSGSVQTKGLFHNDLPGVGKIWYVIIILRYYDTIVVLYRGSASINTMRAEFSGAKCYDTYNRHGMRWQAVI